MRSALLLLVPLRCKVVGKAVSRQSASSNALVFLIMNMCKNTTKNDFSRSHATQNRDNEC